MFLINSVIKFIDFHQATTSTGVGESFEVTPSMSSVLIDFSGTNTFSATFEGKLNGKWHAISGFNLDENLSYGTVVDTFDGLWQVSLIGLDAFRVNLTAITGEITVFGKVVG